MDDCFGFFAPILNGIAFEFSKCYMQCSNETENDERLKSNIRISYAKDVGEEEDLQNLDYEVEKCRNASKRGYVENTYLTFLELQECIMSNDIIEPATTANRSSSNDETETLVGANQETTKVTYSGYKRRPICDID